MHSADLLRDVYYNNKRIAKTSCGQTEGFCAFNIRVSYRCCAAILYNALSAV